MIKQLTAAAGSRWHRTQLPSDIKQKFSGAINLDSPNGSVAGCSSALMPLAGSGMRGLVIAVDSLKNDRFCDGLAAVFGTKPTAAAAGAATRSASL